MKERLAGYLQKYEDLWQNAEAQAFLQTRPGLIIVLGVAVPVAALITPNTWLLGGLAICGIFLFPGRRETILAVASLGFLSTQIGPKVLKYISQMAPELIKSGQLDRWHVTLLILLSALTCIFWADSVKKLAANQAGRKYALAALLTVIFTITWLFAPLRNAQGWLPIGLSVFAMGLASYAWFFAYDVSTGDFPQRSPRRERLAYYLPFWNLYFIVPVPRGEFSLKQSSLLDDPQKLAELRLKAIRLMIWAGALHLIEFETAKRTSFVPTIHDALKMVGDDHGLSSLAAWQIIGLSFFLDICQKAAIGHLAVAFVWLCGYSAPYNMDRPIGATRFLEFFNRYSYYFKEMLLHIFYYPAFFGKLGRKLKDKPRLRILYASLMSVGIGNFLFHATLIIHVYFGRGFSNALVRSAPYAFYCFALSTLVAVSMIRSNTRSERRDQSILIRSAQALIVVTTFALLHIFDIEFSGDIRNNFKLALAAFGVDLK